jgi:hypothetical protein
MKKNRCILLSLLVVVALTIIVTNVKFVTRYYSLLISDSLVPVRTVILSKNRRIVMGN